MAGTIGGLRYLLDTNIVSDLLRHPAGAVSKRIDRLIAAHACALDLTLVTDNTSEFARVANLRIENWLEPR
ncbi:MAG: hypothetical protein MUF04_10915 [Akkermansiaceae bacterium]|nr:hypothetical protein [Akkermansiaceae bacterium]